MAIPTIDFLTRNLRHGVNRRTGIFGFLGGLAGIAGVSSVEATIAKPPVDCRSTGMQCLTGAECCSGRCITKSDGTARCARKTSNRKKRKKRDAGDGAAPLQCTVCASGCPYTTIEDAIAAADSYDTITIAAGTYDPVPRDAWVNGSITIDKNLLLRACDPHDRPVIVNTSSTTRSILIYIGRLTETYDCDDFAPTAFLDGLILQGGPTAERGAILAGCNADFVLSNSVVQGFSTVPATPHDYAPITLNANGSATIFNTRIVDNTGLGTTAATAFLFYPLQSNTSMTITDCEISGNAGGAAAIVAGQYGTITLSGTTVVRDNTSTGANGGGAWVGGPSSALILEDDATITGNSCTTLGGGIYAGTDATVTGVTSGKVLLNAASGCANYYSDATSTCILS